MDIHFVSTLTPEDEDRYAPMVLAAVRAILEPMPITYAVRIVTANGLSVQHTKADQRRARRRSPPPAEPVRGWSRRR